MARSAPVPLQALLLLLLGCSMLMHGAAISSTATLPAGHSSKHDPAANHTAPGPLNHTHNLTKVPGGSDAGLKGHGAGPLDPEAGPRDHALNVTGHPHNLTKPWNHTLNATGSWNGTSHRPKPWNHTLNATGPWNGTHPGPHTLPDGAEEQQAKEPKDPKGPKDQRPQDLIGWIENGGSGDASEAKPRTGAGGGQLPGKYGSRKFRQLLRLW